MRRCKVGHFQPALLGNLPPPLICAPITGETRPRVIWYEDSAMMRLHCERVKAGMERARPQGKRIGRPRVSERPAFPERFTVVLERLGRGEVSWRHAANELGIGYATLKRLLDARLPPPDNSDGVVVALAAAANRDGRGMGAITCPRLDGQNR